MSRIRVAVDPGTYKCGWAIGPLVSDSFLKGTVNLEMLREYLTWIRRHFSVGSVIIGGGTNSQTVAEICGSVFADDVVSVVDESLSTVEARRLFLLERGEVPLRVLLRSIHLLLLNPPLDGYSALCLLKRKS